MRRDFPVEGEQITRDDGAVYVWAGGAWHWAGFGVSRLEVAHGRRLQRKARLRLHRDLLAWIGALDEVHAVKTSGGDLRQSDPRESFTELVLRAALTDSIAETTDGMRLGLETLTEVQVSGLIGMVRTQAIRIAVTRHRLRVAPLTAHAQAGGDLLGKPVP
jgi:hypothetical protein